MYEPVHTYLQACALVRKRRAEETCDNAHDCFGYITLQHGICMLPVTCVVAHLRKDRDGNCMRHGYFMALPRYKRLVTLVHYYLFRQKSLAHTII